MSIKKEMTINSLIEELKHLEMVSPHGKIRADQAWALLEEIGGITDEARRVQLYTTFRQWSNRALGDLCVQHRAMTLRRYTEVANAKDETAIK